MRLIDADALWYKLHKRICKIDNGRTYRPESMPIVVGIRIDELEFCMEQIQCEPTIEAEPVRHGQWLNVDINWQRGYTIAQCSECGEKIKAYEAIEKIKFCHYCGAKMDGGARNESIEK